MLLLPLTWPLAEGTGLEVSTHVRMYVYIYNKFEYENTYILYIKHIFFPIYVYIVIDWYMGSENMRIETLLSR